MGADAVRRSVMTACRRPGLRLSELWAVCLEIWPSSGDQNVILKFSLVISLVFNKDTGIEALAPASVFHHCLVFSCLAHFAWPTSIGFTCSPLPYKSWISIDIGDADLEAL